MKIKNALIYSIVSGRFLRFSSKNKFAKPTSFLEFVFPLLLYSVSLPCKKKLLLAARGTNKVNWQFIYKQNVAQSAQGNVILHKLF